MLRARSLASSLLSFGLLILLPPSGWAAWVPVGPFGGDARSLVADPENPDRMYLGTRTGQVYATTDGGRTWNRLLGFAAPENWVVDDLVIEPSQPKEPNKPREPREPKVLYAGMWSLGLGGGGVYKTTDGGRSWAELRGLAGQSVRALALAPSNPRILVAGTRDGVFGSEDAGTSWRRISPLGHPEIRNLESVAIDPRDPDVIYIGTWHLPWKTADGGAHWSLIHKGVIDDSDVFSLVVNPSNPNNLYLGACTGIYRSDSGAAEWRKIQGIPSSSRRTQTLVLDPRNPSIVYAGTTEGLWQTRNGGQAWTRLAPETWVINAVVVDPRDPAHFYLAMDHAGVMESRDGGKTFRPANQGFAQRQVSRLVADPQEPGRFYAALLHNNASGAVYATSDSGASWQQQSAGLAGRDVLSLLILPQPPARLLAGTHDGVFEYSAEQGTWQNKSQWELPGNKAGARSVSVGVWDLYQRRPGELAYAATSQGLFQSRDGRAWKRVAPGLAPDAFFAVAALGDAGATILAATATGLQISRDGGRNWAALDLGVSSRLSIHRMVSHPVAPNRVFVATDRGLFRSADAGVHWERFGRGLPLSAVLDVLLSPVNPEHILVASIAGMFRSLDGGDRFERADDAEGAEGLTVRFLAIHPQGGNAILAATGNNGVFRNGLRSLLP